MRNIELIPAIDIIEGCCVRLSQGAYESKKVYDDSPLDVAMRFEDAGARRLHVVDLDGAKAKHVVNNAVLRDIATHTSLTIDFGGGVKSDDDMDKVLDAGAHLVTVGSVAATEPDMFLAWLEHYGTDKIILGADVKDGHISINGWKEEADSELMTFLRNYHRAGVRHVLCTDISRDGMLQGPSVTLYRNIMSEFPDLHLIASGGVSSMNDIFNLEQAGIPAVVFGKAFYEGHISLYDIQEFMRERSLPTQ